MLNKISNQKTPEKKPDSVKLDKNLLRNASGGSMPLEQCLSKTAKLKRRCSFYNTEHCPGTSMCARHCKDGYFN